MVIAEVVGERGLGGGDRKGNEGGTDDTKHELQLAAAHGGGLRAWLLVMMVAEVGAQHPGLDKVGVAKELAATGTASGPAEGCKHLLGDGHLQHRLQAVLAIQIRAKLSHSLNLIFIYIYISSSFPLLSFPFSSSLLSSPLLSCLLSS